jgi:hypothetical protein
MKSGKTLNAITGRVRATVEVIEGEPATIHDYGIPGQAWIRGVKLMKHFGSDKALDLIDQRAERAADRGNHKAARRWRDLITAIHAIETDERLLGENMH